MFHRAKIVETLPRRKQRLLIDLSGMDFISSVGIRMLLQAIKLTSSTSGKLLFLNPSPFAKAALETAGFSQLIAIGSLEEISSVI
jgi:anti-anti-sigma factor